VAGGLYKSGVTIEVPPAQLSRGQSAKITTRQQFAAFGVSVKPSHSAEIMTYQPVANLRATCSRTAGLAALDHITSNGKQFSAEQIKQLMV
jgi:hypothetical protein